MTVEVRRKSFTDHPSKSKLLSEKIELKVEPNASQKMIQWLVSNKMDFEYSKISISHTKDEGVDFVVTEYCSESNYSRPPFIGMPTLIFPKIND